MNSIGFASVVDITPPSSTDSPGSESNSFDNRAKRRRDVFIPTNQNRCDARNCGRVIAFKTGEEIIAGLIVASQVAPIDRVDVFSHSSRVGIRGSDSSDKGLYRDDYNMVMDDFGNSLHSHKPLGEGGTRLTSIIGAMFFGQIRFNKKCEICFWGCKTFDLAVNLHQNFLLVEKTCKVALEIDVIGTTNLSEPIKDESGTREVGIRVKDRGVFKSARTGKELPKREFSETHF